ncbi:hypothetical protein niasHT_038176 [Heterodera trifolii]|uniref:Uncharacterized protein n=1 Tax=Heterodera trifolii TaxID=157864 RepID=A0ABD2IN36_9BILA
MSAKLIVAESDTSLDATNSLIIDTTKHAAVDDGIAISALQQQVQNNDGTVEKDGAVVGGTTIGGTTHGGTGPQIGQEEQIEPTADNVDSAIEQQQLAQNAGGVVDGPALGGTDIGGAQNNGGTTEMNNGTTGTSAEPEMQIASGSGVGGTTERDAGSDRVLRSATKAELMKVQAKQRRQMGKRTGGAPRGPKIVAGACASPERKKRQTKHYNKLNRANITVSNSAPNVPTIIRTLEGERSYRVKAVLASYTHTNGKTAYFLDWLRARGQECWIPSESCDCLEMAIDFTKKANVHDVLRGLLGEPIAESLAKEIMASPKFIEVCELLGRDPATVLKFDELNISFAPSLNMEDIQYKKAVGQLGQFIKNCLEAAPAPEQSDSEDE